jgi:hypothetical protein
MILKKQDGFHVIEAAIVLVVLAVIGFVGYKVMNGSEEAKNDNKQSANNTSGSDSSGPPIWEYNQQKLEWFVKSGKAPDCKDPFKLDMSPVDMSKITAVGLPGAYRGFSYKAHGGFRAAASTDGNLEVKLPMDANLRGITRYYEAIPGYPDELQYLVDFETDCGIAFRFDHLLTLTPEFQAVAEKSPAPKKDDTRGDPNAPRISTPFKAGTVVATGVGFPSAQNYGFDFGVYDYREPNEISRNKQWADIHKDFSAQHFHGICWVPLLPGDDVAKAEAMAKDRNNYNSSKPFNLTSDYCTFAPYNTLDFNNGQPTDG